MFRFLKDHWLTLIVLALLLAGTVYVVRTKRPPGAMTVVEAQAMDMKVMKAPVGTAPVAVETVALEPFQSSVTYTGTVDAWDDEDVVARVAGRVVEMPVYPGDRVQAGQVVVRLDSVELSALEASSQAGAGESRAQARSAEAMVESAARSLEVAESQVAIAGVDREEAVAEIESAEIKLKYWAAELERAQNLYEAGAISLEELQLTEADEASARVMLHHKHVRVKAADERVLQARKAVAGARAEVARARAEAEGAQAAMARSRAQAAAAATVRDYTVIRSQVSGDVTRRLVSPGTVVMPGTVLLKIKKVDRLRLQARVPSEQAGRIRTGARVWARPRSGGEALETRITSVFRAADPASRTVTVEAALENPVSDHVTLYPGDFVEMEIATDGPEEALTVPLRALRKDLEGNPYVWVVERAASKAGETKYTCTMHPEVVEDHPGKCPKCKMDLVPMERTGDLRARRRPVVPGYPSGTRVAIARGLEAGDEVIVEGYQDLNEGTAVAVVEWGPEGPVTLPSATSPVEAMPGHGSHGASDSSGSPGGDGAEHKGHSAAPASPQGGHEGHGEGAYTCPMHPEVRSDEPGSCPKCGMDLVKEEAP